MVTASVSASTEVSEDLLSYFVDIGNKECYSAMLYICFDLLREDVVEELSWQHGLNDFVMPYKIQKKRTLIERVSDVLAAALIRSLILGCVACCVGEGGQRAVAEGDPKGAAGGGPANHKPRLQSPHVDQRVCSWIKP